MAARNQNVPSASDLLNGANGNGPEMGGIGSAPAGADADQDQGQAATSAEMQELRAQIAALTEMMHAQAKSSGQAVPKIPKERQYTARVAFLDDKLPIVAYSGVKLRKVEGKEVEFLLVGVMQADGKVKESEVPYLQFMERAPRYLATIVAKTKRKETLHQGPVPVRHLTIPRDPLKIGDDGGQVTPHWVDLEHEFDVTTCTVRFAEGPMSGKELVINAEALNR